MNSNLDNQVASSWAELLEPAVRGTVNVLRSCAKVSSIKKVVITSSVAAVSNNRELKEDVVIDESWFSDPSYCEEQKSWYALSKTLAEDAAWKFTKEHGIEIITIYPGFVVGPILQPSINLNIELILNLVNGARAFPNATLRWVDVRDVGDALIIAFEIPSASGRYCLVERSAHAPQVIKILRGHYPTYKFLDKLSDNTNLFYPAHTISNEKAKNLGVQFIPLEAIQSGFENV
ncbi:phenylacetaldehyde reductase-like [Coffea arabica]|uniref:Phenylacetaldehyde reductase-like n=1 Tax=Coffea arabica TaxID=13443 RepID=A0ABM4WP97_COFAR